MNQPGPSRARAADQTRAVPASQKRSHDMRDEPAPNISRPDRFTSPYSQRLPSAAQMPSTGETSSNQRLGTRSISRQKEPIRAGQLQREQDQYQSQLQPPSQALKVAIPRLPRDHDALGFYGGARDTGDKARVSHACEPCRSRKTKCSGERPTCAHCEEYKLTCVYADGKRDRAKR